MNVNSSGSPKLALLALLLAACLAMACVVFPVRSVLIIVATLGLAVYCAVAFKFPEAFLAASAFMPQWKTTWPVSRVDHMVDVTLLMLAGLFLGITWRLLLKVSGLDRRKLADMFRGQWPLILAYFLFSLLVALSYLYTNAPHYGGSKLVRLLLIGTLLLISGLLLINEERDFRRFAFLFVGCGCVTAAQMVLHLQERSANAEGDITRIGAGWLLGMSMLLLVCYPFYRKPSHNSALMMIGLPVLSAGLIASAARGPIVSLIVILPLTYFGFARRRLDASRALLVGVLIVSCVGSYIYLRHADPGKYNSKINELIRITHGNTSSGTGAKRISFYRTTLDAIPEHFWFGRGVGSWSVFYYGKDSRGYPHNLFLETTFEEGFVGQLALFLFLCLLTWAGYRLLRRGDVQYGVLAGLLLYCVTVSMISGDLDDNRLLWLWAGMMMAVCRNVRTNRYVLVTNDPHGASGGKPSGLFQVQRPLTTA